MVLALATASQGFMYQGAEHLWRETLARNEKSWLAHYNLGDVLAQQGRTAEAQTSLEAAVRFDPDYAGAQFSLGNLLAAAGQPAAAAAHFQAATGSAASTNRGRCRGGACMPD